MLDVSLRDNFLEPMSGLASMNSAKINPEWILAENGGRPKLLLDQINLIAPRLKLSEVNSPFHALPRLTSHFDCSPLWIKRDDIGNFGIAGSKARKLERVLFQAMLAGSDEIATSGPPTSNTCRALAAACAQLGLHATIFMPGEQPKRLSGNAWMARQFGAEIIWAGSVSWSELDAMAQTYAAARRRTFLAPPGVSDTGGILGITAAYAELMLQCHEAGIEPKCIVHASATGGMCAGLNIGAKLLGGPPVVSIAIVDNLYSDMLASYRRLGIDAANLLKLTDYDVDLRFDYLESGYGRSAPKARAMANTVAKLSGVLVDPLYTGKAFVAAVDIARAIKDDRPVIFWHTGGVQGYLSPSMQYDAQRSS